MVLPLWCGYAPHVEWMGGSGSFICRYYSVSPLYTIHFEADMHMWLGNEWVHMTK